MKVFVKRSWSQGWDWTSLINFTDHLYILGSVLGEWDIQQTPNLRTLVRFNCLHFVHVSNEIGYQPRYMDHRHCLSKPLHHIFPLFFPYLRVKLLIWLSSWNILWMPTGHNVFHKERLNVFYGPLIIDILLFMAVICYLYFSVWFIQFIKDITLKTIQNFLTSLKWRDYMKPKR